MNEFIREEEFLGTRVLTFDRKKMSHKQKVKDTIKLSLSIGLKLGMITAVAPLSVVNLMCFVVPDMLMDAARRRPGTVPLASKSTYEALGVLIVIGLYLAWILVSELITACFCIPITLTHAELAPYKQRNIAKKAVLAYDFERFKNTLSLGENFAYSFTEVKNSSSYCRYNGVETSFYGHCVLHYDGKEKFEEWERRMEKERLEDQKKQEEKAAQAKRIANMRQAVNNLQRKNSHGTVIPKGDFLDIEGYELQMKARQKAAEEMPEYKPPKEWGYQKSWAYRRYLSRKMDEAERRFQ